MVCADRALHSQADTSVQDLSHSRTDVQKEQTVSRKGYTAVIVGRLDEIGAVKVHQLAYSALHILAVHLRFGGYVERFQHNCTLTV